MKLLNYTLRQKQHVKHEKHPRILSNMSRNKLIFYKITFFFQLSLLIFRSLTQKVQLVCLEMFSFANSMDDVSSYLFACFVPFSYISLTKLSRRLSMAFKSRLFASQYRSFTQLASCHERDAQDTWQLDCLVETRNHHL